MSKYDKFFTEMEQSITKALDNHSPGLTGSTDVTKAIADLTEKVDTLYKAVHPTEGPIAKTLEALKSDQDLVNQAVEKSLERLEIVEKSGARPHSVAGDNGTVTQMTEVEKASAEWDSLIHNVLKNTKGPAGRAR